MGSSTSVTRSKQGTQQKGTRSKQGTQQKVTRSKQGTQQDEKPLLDFETWLKRLSTSPIIHPDTKPAQVHPASEFIRHEALRTASTGDIMVFAWKVKEDDPVDTLLHAAMKKYDSSPQDLTHSGIIIQVSLTHTGAHAGTHTLTQTLTHTHSHSHSHSHSRTLTQVPNSERRFVLESTTAACLDVLEGTHTSRVSGASRLFSAEYRAAQYPGDVYLLKQKVALLPEQERMLLLQAHKIWCRNPGFDMAGLTLCGLHKIPALKEVVHPPKNDFNAWFCSELVACCLRVCVSVSVSVSVSECV